jgi:hypothetical protein
MSSFPGTWLVQGDANQVSNEPMNSSSGFRSKPLASDLVFLVKMLFISVVVFVPVVGAAHFWAFTEGKCISSLVQKKIRNYHLPSDLPVYC